MTAPPAPRVVAEAGQCKGSVDYAIEAMRAAKAAGCWATKIQLLQPDTIAVADAAIYWHENRPEIQDQRTNFATTGCLPYDSVPDLMDAAAEIGIELFASPFDLEAVDVMAKAGMRYCKIASGDVTNRPLVSLAAEAFPHGIIMALGAANEPEILRAVDWITDEGARPHALLACSLCYPTPLDRAELRRIHTLRQLAGEEGWTFEIGYSDHTPGWEAGGLAVAAGATLLEKHYTLDAKDPTVPDNNFALDPAEIAEYVKAANKAHAAFGVGSLDPTDIEMPARLGARRSICAVRDLPAGHVLTADDLTFLRPAAPDGLDPSMAAVVVSCTLTVDVPAGTAVPRDALGRAVKVAIVGQAPRSFEYPDDHEVWVINGPHVPARWDRLFQLHGVDHLDHKHAKDGLWDVISAAQSAGRRTGTHRLIMTRTHPDDERLAHAEPYPLDEVLLAGGRRYLTNSFALCVALAVHEGAERIVLDGLMVPQGAGQWDAGESWIGPCIEYHLGRAEALAIEVVVPPGCGLFRLSEFVYGFEGPGSV